MKEEKKEEKKDDGYPWWVWLGIIGGWLALFSFSVAFMVAFIKSLFGI
jgi:hypothetical protein